MLTTIKKQALLAATIALIAGLITPACNAVASEHSTTIEALFVALGQGDWQAADRVAAALDADAEDKSLFSTFARATQLVANNDCASGGPLAENVVSRSPLFLPAYDLIAKCLVEAGENEHAAAMFDQVAAGLNKGAERDAILARAQSLRPDMSPKYSVDFNLQPSTNVNRGTDNETIGSWAISDQARTKAGVTFGAFATVDKPVYVSKRLISSVSLRAGVSYDTVSSQFLPTVRLSSNTRFLLSPKTSLGAVLSYEHIMRGGSFESASSSLAVDVSHQVSPTLSLGARAEVAYTQHSNDAQSGITAKLNANAGMIVSANDRINAAASYVLEAREGANHSFHQIGLAAEWEHAFENGMIGSLGAEASYRLYESNAPLTADKQHNIQAKATIGVSHRDFMIGKFRPELAYTLTKQWSNDAFSDFSAHDVSVRAKAGF